MTVIDRARRLVQRRRRIVAGGCAALAVLVLLGSRTSSGPAPADAPLRPQAGRVAVPITVTASGLVPGAHIDLVRAVPDATAIVVAHDARVLQASGAGWNSTGSSAILVEVDESDSLALVSAAAAGQVVPVLRAY